MQGSQPCAAAWLYLKQPPKTARGQCAHIYGEVLDSCTERVGLRTVRLERDFTPGKQVFRIRLYNRLPGVRRGYHAALGGDDRPIA